MGIETNPLTLDRLIAARDAMAAADVLTPDVMYVTAEQWRDLGGDMSIWEALPAVGLGADPRELPADRVPGEVSDEPTPEPGDSEPHPDADTSPSPVMQDRRKPR